MEEPNDSGAGLGEPYYRINYESTLYPLWEGFTKIPPHDSISRQMIMMDNFEEALRIRELSPENTSPLPITLTTMNKATDLYTSNLKERTIQRLLAIRMPEASGMSIKQLLELPTYELRSYFRALSEVRRKEPSIPDINKLPDLGK